MINRFPVQNLTTALALHTAGYPITPDEKFHEADATRHRTWWVNARAAEAQGLVQSFHDPEPKQNLQSTDPTHPFLAARWGVEAFEVLTDWLSGRIPPPAVVRTAGPLLRLAPAATVPAGCDWQAMVWSGGMRPGIRVDEVAYAAALIVCGFPCWPQIIPPGNGKGPGFAFPLESLTFPALTQALLCQVVNEQRNGIRITPLPGYAMGEHPFDYAFQGALNVPHLESAAKPAAANPTVVIKGRSGGAVLASMSLLSESNPRSEFRDEVQKFLA